jgi:hypothetical protein
MTINFLTTQQVEKEIDKNVDLVQLFTRDYKFTFFITKEEYEEESVLNSVAAAFLVPNYFYYGAYWVFVNNTTPSKFADLEHFVQRMRPGITVGTLDDFNGLIGNPAIPHEKEDNKFTAQHFPKGTLVTVSTVISGMGVFHKSLYPSVFYITKVIQNGADSFVLETSTVVDSLTDPEDEAFKFNMNHVDTIVMRGTGELVVERFSYNKNRVDMLNAAHEFPDLARKNRWLTHGAVELVRLMVSQLPRREGAVVDNYRLASYLLDQSFVKEVPVGKSYSGANVYLFSINKKRAKCFVKQNVNRFLSSAKKAQKKYDDMFKRASWAVV